MATRFTFHELEHLRDSPLCVKPNSLPPVEDWMGPPPETFRNNQGTGKTGTERTKNGDNSLTDQTNRRPGLDRHTSRSNTTAEAIVLGPPRTTFSSSTLSRGVKPFESDKSFGSFRRNGDSESDRQNDRERGDRDRDGRSNLRRRGEGDESDGWSTVKPRKSFGHEGAERFNGRMGLDRNERPGGERRTRDNQEEATDRPKRNNFGEYAREKEGDDGEKPRRNGLARNRNEQPATWNRGNEENNDPPPPTRERFDRAKSWRERAAPPQDQATDERPRERNTGRYDRDHRQEREPEWFDEPVDEKQQGHTVQDLQQWMEDMKARNEGGVSTKINPASIIDTSTSEGTFEAEAAKVQSAPAVEFGPDQFFAKYASTPSAENEHPHEMPKETASTKGKGGSRFGSFFASQQGRQTEPSTPAAIALPAQEPNPLSFFGGGDALNTILQSGPHGNLGGGVDKAAFDNILMKLKRQQITPNTPPSGGFPAPQNQERGPQSSMASPVSYPPFVHEQREGPPSRGLPQEIMAHRQQLQQQQLQQQQQQQLHQQQPQQLQQPTPSNYMPQAPITTEAQLLQNLIAQRQPMGGQAPGRGDQSQTRNSQTEFLMSLMQSGRNAPEAQRSEPLIRMPQPSRPAQIPQTPDREPDYQRERGVPHQQGRHQGPPGFFEEPHIRHDQDNRRQQPTQILQRPGPMALDQMQPNWLQGAGQQGPPGPGRPMIPPPGLAGNPRNDLRNDLRNDPRIDPRIDPRNAQMPGIFPPGFPPMGVFPPDAMRNMAPPPGLFGGPGGPGVPPPGFLPPGMGAGAFHGGPEALAFGGYDGRGMPPANFRRN